MGKKRGKRTQVVGFVPLLQAVGRPAAAVISSGDARLRSHSFMKSDAVRLRLLGVNLFMSAWGSRSSSLLGLDAMESSSSVAAADSGGDGSEPASRSREACCFLLIGPPLLMTCCRQRGTIDEEGLTEACSRSRRRRASRGWSG